MSVKKINNLAMAYHCCPLPGYQWNLERLAQYQGCFELKVVGLATLEKINTEKVCDEIYNFLGKDTIIKKVPNDPINRESATFHTIMRQLDIKLDRKNSAIWYGHTKGITHTKRKYSDVTKLWASACYYYTLSDEYLSKSLSLIEQNYSIVGPFRRVGEQRNFPKQQWPVHYSGTFFWLNAKDFFASQWKTAIPRHRYGVEALPGILFPNYKCGCVIADRVKDLYKMSAWEKILKPELIQELVK